jgi:hypothetical protein
MRKLEMAAIFSIIGFLLFLYSYYSSLSVESIGVWGGISGEGFFWLCSMLCSLSIFFFGALFTLIFLIDRMK